MNHSIELKGAEEMQSFPVRLYLKTAPRFATRARRYADGTFRLVSLNAVFFSRLNYCDIERVQSAFKVVLKGELFTDLGFTAVWRKVDENTGECVASDGAFVVGQGRHFGADETVNIELMESAG